MTVRLALLLALATAACSKTPRTGTPVLVSGITNAIAIAAGRYHTCALLSGRAVSCWGDNSDGQLGGPPFQTKPVAVAW